MFLVRSARIADHSDSPPPLGVHGPAICLSHRGGDHWTSDGRGHAPGTIIELTLRFRKRHPARTDPASSSCDTLLARGTGLPSPIGVRRCVALLAMTVRRTVRVLRSYRVLENAPTQGIPSDRSGHAPQLRGLFGIDRGS
jgi:hypothetical protein